MTQEEKDLVLHDLCSRLSYGVKAQVCGWDEEKGEVEVPLKIYSINTDGYVSFETNNYDVNYLPVENVRPYLRPLLSMTEDEYKELKSIDSYYGFAPYEFIYDWSPNYDVINWLNAHHFDYRGLIPNGLAISTEIFNPYK